VGRSFIWRLAVLGLAAFGAGCMTTTPVLVEVHVLSIASGWSHTNANNPIAGAEPVQIKVLAGSTTSNLLTRYLVAWTDGSLATQAGEFDSDGES
jgi:hypothetical protein